jgi:hypothetical protein
VGWGRSCLCSSSHRPSRKVFFSAIVALLVLASAALVHRLGGNPLLAAASAGILAHGWLLTAGFTAYLKSLALKTALYAKKARLLKSDEPRAAWPRVVLVGLGFGLLFFAHLAKTVTAAGI